MLLWHHLSHTVTLVSMKCSFTSRLPHPLLPLSVDEKKAAELKKIEVTSEKIVNLLQAISRKTAQSENAVGMSEDKFNEMRSDLDFKQMQMDNSISTSARLEGEHQRRKVRVAGGFRWWWWWVNMPLFRRVYC